MVVVVLCVFVCVFVVLVGGWVGGWASNEYTSSSIVHTHLPTQSLTRTDTNRFYDYLRGFFHFVLVSDVMEIEETKRRCLDLSIGQLNTVLGVRFAGHGSVDGARGCQALALALGGLLRCIGTGIHQCTKIGKVCAVAYITHRSR